MSKKNYDRLPHDVVDSDVEFYLFENQKTIASEIGAFSVSLLGDRKGQSVTIEHIPQMSNASTRERHAESSCLSLSIVIAIWLKSILFSSIQE